MNSYFFSDNILYSPVFSKTLKLAILKNGIAQHYNITCQLPVFVLFYMCGICVVKTTDAFYAPRYRKKVKQSQWQPAKIPTSPMFTSSGVRFYSYASSLHICMNPWSFIIILIGSCFSYDI